MIFIRTLPTAGQFARGVSLAALALALTACMATDVDDTTGSHLTQAPLAPDAKPRKPEDMDDIAIVGQVVAHAIMDLPVVATAPTPPLVQFTGVTSIIVSPVPIDTDPYTELLRDRLLLLTREKLRFVERTLPPLVVSSPKKGKKKKQAQPSSTPEVAEDPDYQILAEMRGKYDDDLYRIQVQFVDIHTNEVLFDGLYRIRKEASIDPVNDSAPDSSAPPPAPTSADQPAPPPETAPTAQPSVPGIQ